MSPCWDGRDRYSLRTGPDEGAEESSWSEKCSMGTVRAAKSVAAWFVLNCRGTGERVTDEDLVLLTPFRRYKKYRQFPLDIVLHVVVLALVISQAVLLSSEYLSYSRNTAITIQNTFLTDDVRGGIFTVPDAIEFMQTTVDKYYLFPAVSLARYASFLVPAGNHTGAASYEEEASLSSADEELRASVEAAMKRRGLDSVRQANADADAGTSADFAVKWSRAPIMMKVTKFKDLYGSFWQLNCPDNVTELVNHYNNAGNGTEVLTRTQERVVREALFYPPAHVGEETGIEREVLDASSYFSDTIWLSYDDITIVTADDEVDSYEIEGDFSLEESVYPLTLTSPLGPFTADLSSCELQELFYSVTQVTLSFTYQSVNIGTLAILPYQWDVEVVLDFVGGLADPSINIQTSVISVNGISASDITNLINVVLVVCALLSAGLSVVSIAHNLAVYRRTRSRYRHLQRAAMPGDEYPSWAVIPLRVHPSFFNLWEIFNVIGNVAVCLSCLAAFLEEYTNSTSSMFLVTFGIASFLTFVNMTKYFEYFPLLYLHVETLRHAAVYVMTYCVSVLPLYAGFVVFGVLNFGPYSAKFTNVGKTIISLFSLLNGDDIYPTFTEIEDNQYPHPWVSRAYIIIFVTTFITSVLNVFIFIIEDSYRVAKHHNLYKDRENAPRHLLVDGMAIPVSRSGREMLELIFRNLYTWSERIESNPGIFDAVPDTGEEELQEIRILVPEAPEQQQQIQQQQEMAPFASHRQNEELLDRAAEVSKQASDKRKKRPRSRSTQLPVIPAMTRSSSRPAGLSSSSNDIPQKTRRPSVQHLSSSSLSDSSDAEESSLLSSSDRVPKLPTTSFLEVSSAATMRRKDRKAERNDEPFKSASIPTLGIEGFSLTAEALPASRDIGRTSLVHETAPQDAAGVIRMIQTEIIAQRESFQHRFRQQELELQRLRAEHHKALTNIVHLCQALEPMLPPEEVQPTLTVIDEDEVPDRM